MKAIRVNKRKDKEKGTRNSLKPIEVDKRMQAESDAYIGKMVMLRALPTRIKRAKRLFEVGKLYEIKQPPKNHGNSLMSVYLEGADKKVYQVQFGCWVLQP